MIPAYERHTDSIDQTRSRPALHCTALTEETCWNPTVERGGQVGGAGDQGHLVLISSSSGRVDIVTTATMAVMDMMTALKLPTHMDGFLYPLGELGADRVRNIFY